jgi:serine protease Do
VLKWGGRLGCWGVVGVIFGLCAVTATSAASTPPAKEIKLPAHVSVAIYLPAQLRRWHGLGGAFQSGRTLEDTVLSAAQVFFNDSHMAEAATDAPFGLLLALHPDLKNESSHLVYTLNYSVFGADDTPLLKYVETVTVEGIDVDAAILRATQQAMTNMITSLHPDEAKYPAVLNLKSRSLEFAASKDKPWANGTGFYFNANGQVLTAAHVIQDCVKIDVKRDDKVLPGKVLARSNVVDVAVLDTGNAAPAFLSFRKNLNFELGEPITDVGYPLQTILAETPNLTRGNVSARGGLTGSFGQFQFSAPIQPGASGGPVVSDGGEVLGIAVGTLNAAALAKQGIIPQNVNFALEARYAAKFLQKNNLTFALVEPNPHGDAHIANQAALAAVVNVQCYE